MVAGSPFFDVSCYELSGKKLKGAAFAHGALDLDVTTVGFVMCRRDSPSLSPFFSAPVLIGPVKTLGEVGASALGGCRRRCRSLQSKGLCSF